MSIMQSGLPDRLFQFTREITSTTELKCLYRKIVLYAKEIMQFDFSTLMLLSEDRARLVMYDTIGFPESEIGTFALVSGQGLSTHVIKTKRPETVEDFNSESRFSVPPVVFQKNITSAASVPMIIGDDVFGVLIGHTHDRRIFRPEELQVFQNMGNLSAIAIKNAMNMRSLSKAKDEWELTFNAVPDMIAIIDDQYRIVRMNRSMADSLGTSEHAAVGAFCYELVHNLQAPPFFCPHTTMLLDGQEKQSEIYEERLGRHFLVSVTPYFYGDGRPAGSIHVARDITELKKNQKLAEDGRAFLQKIIDGISTQIMVMDADYRIRLMNSAAKQRNNSAGEVDAGAFCYMISHRRNTPCEGTDHPCPLRAVRESGHAVTVTHTHRMSDGTEYIVEILASPVFNAEGEFDGIIEICRDITEKLRLEELKIRLDQKTVQQQKSDSILTLAAGIAHDFNNILMSVMGNAELLVLRLQQSEKERMFAENIMKSSERMADLTNQLLAYAGGGKYNPKAISAGDSVRDALAIVHKGKALNVAVNLDIADAPGYVYADQSQMNQVFINLFANAFEAMEDIGGSLTIHAANETRSEVWECGTFRHEHPAGDYIHITVADTGPGIAPEFHQKIFDPFFSTKFLGRGLGLAAVAGILQGHKGCISVESRSGCGATFHVYLPVARRTEDAAASGGHSGQMGQAESILIVDDEPQITDLLKEMLLSFGYGALAASDGTEALAIFRKAKGAIDLAILDIQMPGMSGKTLFRELKALKPELKVLVSSGYEEQVALAELDTLRPDGFIKKPYRADMLQNMICQILKR